MTARHWPERRRTERAVERSFIEAVGLIQDPETLELQNRLESKYARNWNPHLILLFTVHRELEFSDSGYIGDGTRQTVPVVATLNQ